jgi:hypothetical protein
MKSFPRLPDESQAVQVRFGEEFIELTLADGRRAATPLSFYPTLLAATPAEREQFGYIAEATALEWYQFDLQLSVDSIVAGRREQVPPPGFRGRVIASMKAAGLKIPDGWIP